MRLKATMGILALLAGGSGAAIAADAPVKKFVAVLQPTKGQKAQGRVEFIPKTGTVEVRAEIRGLAPNSMHGFHIHENGDCSNAGEAAGGHFNPTDMPHGGPKMLKHHTGDLGNIQADRQGIAVVKTESPELIVEGNKSITGRAVIVHAGSDDLMTQPTGNSGARIACGVIQEVK